MATSDVHLHLTGWDALCDSIKTNRGLDILACRIKAARQTAPGASVLCDNGDFLQGTPLGATCSAWSDSAPHPWAQMVNALEYDAVGLGNHDFDFGPSVLERVVAQMDAPTLCASLSSGDIAGVIPTVMLQRQLACSDGALRKLNIGVTSVLPPQTAKWNQRFLTGKVTFAPGVAAAQHAVSTLRAQGADIIVVLCHSGLPTSSGRDSENFAARIAQDVAGIDAMIMGHTHQTFPNADGPRDVHGVAAVMPGYGGEALGVIDLHLGWNTAGWAVVDQTVALHRPCDTDTPHPHLTDLATPAITQTQHALDIELTQTATGFHSYFDMLRPSLSGTLLARTMTRCIADAVQDSPLADLPLIAAVANTALGGLAGPSNYARVKEGRVRARHIAVLSPYPNAVWAVVLRGRDLRAWMERSAAYFAHSDNSVGRLVDHGAPSFNFDALHGLQVTLDPFAAPMFHANGQLLDAQAGRVIDLTYRGDPIDVEQQFLVAVTSYRASGGGLFPGLNDKTQIIRTHVDQLAALHRDVAQLGLPNPDPSPPWVLRTERPKRVIIETSPNAPAHLQDIAQFDPHVIGQNTAGFVELNVTI